MKSILTTALLLLLTTSSAFAAGQYCNADKLTTFSPASGMTHQAARLTDPTGQQVALFDVSWGGMLVSLKYNGVEYIASPNTISGAQLILRGVNYTPTQGGDNVNRGSTVTGVACRDNFFWITSGMTDYNRGAGVSTAYVFRNSQWYFDQLMAPYVVSTYATFVPNPLGTPAYYLKLETSVTNIDPTESQLFTHEQVAAVPTRLTYAKTSPVCPSYAPCVASSMPSATMGYYSSTAYTDGLAISTLPTRQWGSDPSGNVTYLFENSSGYNVMRLRKTSWRVAPLTGRTHTTYVMPGSWANAQNYGSRACTFSVTLPADDIVAQTGKSETLTVTAPSGCMWQVWSDDTSVLTVSPSGNMTGTQNVTVTIGPNGTGAIRTANLLIAGREFPYFQQP